MVSCCKPQIQPTISVLGQSTAADIKQTDTDLTSDNTVLLLKKSLTALVHKWIPWIAYMYISLQRHQTKNEIMTNIK